MAYHKDPLAIQLNGKIKNYHNDGSGRDTYVSTNNGGQTSDRLETNQVKTNYVKMHFLTASSKNVKKNVPPQLPIKTGKYWGDGSGRDYFVIVNDGGQSNPFYWWDHPDIKFAKDLRSYPKTQPMQRIQSAVSTKYNKLAEPKKQITPVRRPHTPNARDAAYRSYQTLEYQSKANQRYRNY
ncbi:hypothetical protein pb186bvf_012949 [Paramecium bursaria]